MCTVSFSLHTQQRTKNMFKFSENKPPLGYRLVGFHRFTASVGPVTLFPDVHVLCVMDVVEPA